MTTTISSDGTPIAYTCTGRGPTLILVGGALDDGEENEPLASLLAEHFTTVNYSRRGRGESGDTHPYDVRREIEDLSALLDHTRSGSCLLYGVSSGGALALEATSAGLPVTRLAVYEVPYQIGDDALSRWNTYVTDLAAAEGRPGDLLEIFMHLAGSSDADVAGARDHPAWPRLEGMAHTLAYDAACLGSGLPAPNTLNQITQPTLVLTGAVRDPHMSELTPGFFDDAADFIVRHLPDAQRRVLEGQSHVAAAQDVAPVLREFFEL